MRGWARRAALAGAALALALPGQAWASQWATISAEEAPVHQFANGTSPVLGRFVRGERIPVSSDLIRDVFGDYWYQTLTQTGGKGFVSARHLLADKDRDAQDGMGLQIGTRPRVEEQGSKGWTIALRALGAGAFVSGGAGLGAGGEFEAAMNLLLGERHHLRRMFALAPFAAFASGGAVFGGGLVFRPYVASRLEPEARIRSGVFSGDDESAFGAGLALGSRYPLSLVPGPHFALSLEASGFAGLEAPNPIFASVGFGVGYHF
ncbi:MAG: hypothetical protein IT285_08155 [Bdellovibrionales bacterium]|nr:hypothetical protein [Bdellovibrionales bacterium]